MKYFGLPTNFVRYLADKNVSESDRDVREIEMSVAENSFLRLRSLV